MMVAAEGSVFLEEKGGNDSDYGNAGHGDNNTEAAFFPERGIFHSGKKQKHRWQDDNESYPQQETGRDQIERFACIGIDYIPDHG